MQKNNGLLAFERIEQDHNHGIYGNRTLEDHGRRAREIKEDLKAFLQEMKDG